MFGINTLKAAVKNLTAPAPAAIEEPITWTCQWNNGTCGDWDVIEFLSEPRMIAPYGVAYEVIDVLMTPGPGRHIITKTVETSALSFIPSRF